MTKTAHAELCFQGQAEANSASLRGSRFFISCPKSRFVATYRVADTVEAMRHEHDLERQSCGDFHVTKSRLVTISLNKFGYPQGAYAQDCHYAFKDADRILVLGDCGLHGEWHRNAALHQE